MLVECRGANILCEKKNQYNGKHEFEESDMQLQKSKYCRIIFFLGFLVITMGKKKSGGPKDANGFQTVSGAFNHNLNRRLPSLHSHLPTSNCMVLPR